MHCEPAVLSPAVTPVRAVALSALPPERFCQKLIAALPGDPSDRNVPRQVRGASYTRVMPTAVSAPRLLGWSDALGGELGLDRPVFGAGPEADILAGNRVLPGMVPYAARYGGHQFGHWAGQLGDGRAITLGELIGADGVTRELQLKGAGKTPYSRSADGRAVLRSSVREFMCSEAMFHLGVPTTRALSLVGTGEPVLRDMFYDGRPEYEPGAVVCRVALSFVRFGNFQIHAASDETDILARLADFVIGQHHPELARLVDPAERYSAWFDEVCRRTAVMVAHWMRVGFVHGVMNTDNMSILGDTIDYGPYGWLEGYDPDWTPNTTDADGRRYCFGRQPQNAQWNLLRLADALLSLVPDPKMLEAGLKTYAHAFSAESLRMTADKLGLDRIDEHRDGPLLDEMFQLLEASETDTTIFFRRLACVPVAGGESAATLIEPLLPAFYTDPDALPPGLRPRWLAWLQGYGERVRGNAGFSTDNDALRVARMNRTNPKYVLRNYLAQQAIDALASGDATVMDRLAKVLHHPYDEQPEHEDLAARRPEWARNRAGCSALSCSS